MMMMMTPRPVCSVLIVVKDEPSIAETLIALKPECEALGAECIVVDSSEGRLDAIAQAHGWVKWIDYQQPLFTKSTISQQRNLAVRSARSEILVFCDAGNIPEPRWLEKMYFALKSGKYQSVGGPIIFFDDKKKFIFRRNHGALGDLLEYPTCGNMGFTGYAFNLVGGFNETLLVAEDDDFVWKLAKLGIKTFCLPEAVMNMDLGNRARQRKRSWRYGKGIVNLLYWNRELLPIRFKKNPDIILYPALFLVYPFMFIFALFHPLILSIPVGFSLFLILRNQPSRLAVLNHFDHFIYGAGSIFEVLKLATNKLRSQPIMQYPNEYSAYVHLLDKALNESATPSRFFPPLTSSATLNILLFPLVAPIFRLRGLRIINIHWLIGKWNLHWAKNPKYKFLLFLWFKLWIFSIRVSGVKIVYTVHDLVPHTKIFHNDEQAIEWLVSKSSGLVFLNEYSVKRISGWDRIVPFRVIPEGPIVLNSYNSKFEIRKDLKVPEANTLLVLIGNLQDYKGVDLLITGASQLPKNISIRIAGVCHPSFLIKLEQLLSQIDLDEVDISLNPGFLSESEYADYLSAADYFIYPCRTINNSGSLNSALASGLPVVVPDTEQLDWITPDCKILIQKDLNGVFDFGRIFDEISTMDPERYSQLKIGARKWADQRSWVNNATLYSSLYREILNAE